MPSRHSSPWGLRDSGGNWENRREGGVEREGLREYWKRGEVERKGGREYSKRGGGSREGRRKGVLKEGGWGVDKKEERDR